MKIRPTTLQGTRPDPLSLLTNVVGINPKEVKIGMRVEVAWDDVTPEIGLLPFQRNDWRLYRYINR